MRRKLFSALSRREHEAHEAGTEALCTAQAADLEQGDEPGEVESRLD